MLKLYTSVIITAYNLEDYIVEALDSVFNQTCPPDEVILCDDNSSDKTLKLAKKAYPLIKIIKQDENKGPLLNTLNGVLEASGDVLFFLDADDVWPLNKIEVIVDFYRKNEKTIMVSHMHKRVDEYLNDLNIIDETHLNLKKLRYILCQKERSEFLKKSGVYRKGFWFGSAYSFRASALNKIKFIELIKDYPKIKFCYLDLVLGPYIIYSNPDFNIEYVEDLYFLYRIHKNNSAASNSLFKLRLALDRVESTNILTYEVLSKVKHDTQLSSRYEKILLEIEYLRTLYFYKFINALPLFVRLLNYFLHKKILIKEICRIIIVFIFGVKFFLKIKNR